jgi:protein-S-isoprenylcysteine O-methyltransferase Ste14
LPTAAAHSSSSDRGASGQGAGTPCEAERTQAARLGALLFRNRGWLPVPFVAAPLLLPGRQTVASWVAGGLILAAGEAFRLAGVAAAGTTTRRRSRDVQRLVTYGIFAWTRNPLYVGNLLAWLGVAVASGVLWFVPVAALLFAVEYSLIVRFEEGVLESTFGDEYLSYKRRTPRWLPRPPGRGAESGPHDWKESWWSERSTLLQYLALAAALAVKQYVSART